MCWMFLSLVIGKKIIWTMLFDDLAECWSVMRDRFLI